MNAEVMIVGAGPGGATTALYLLERGIRPVILERESFPRYHIGESLTGECGGAVRRLGLEARMLEARCPVKYGVNVYGTGGRNAFWVAAQERDADGRLRPTWTWQVLRSRFDQMLLDEVVARGAGYVPGEAIEPLVTGDKLRGVRYRTPAGTVDECRAEVLIDASGQSGFLAACGAASPRERGGYDKQIAIFSQLRGARRDPGDAAGNTLIFYRQKHHWAWFIPLDDEIVSVGVVVPSAYFLAQRRSRADFLSHELQTLNPELASRLTDLRFVEDVRSASNYSYRMKRFTGRAFLCVGDAHRFIDPIFSFGLSLAVKEAEFAAESVARYLAGHGRDDQKPFASYERLVDQAQDVVQDLVDCFWEFPLAFQMLVHYAHSEEMVDLFAGRVYGEDANHAPGVLAMRRLLASRRRSDAPDPAAAEEGTIRR